MQITADVSKIAKTFEPDFIFLFDVLSESLFGFVSYSVFLAVEMLLFLQKSVFIENEAAQQCVTMRKRFSSILATIWYKSFLQNICPVDNRNV